MSCRTKYQQDEEDTMSLADIMSLKLNTTDVQKKKSKEDTTWNQSSQHYWFQQQQQQQLQASYHQLQYLQQQQMMSMVRYKSNHSNSSSRRSSSVSSASVHSNNSQRPKPHRSSLLLHQQQQQHISSASSVMSNSSEKSTKSTDSQVKRRQSLGKRIKKVFRMGSATSDVIQEEYPLSPQSLPNTPTSTRPPLRHPYRHPSSSCDLPSPALSTVSTLSSSTTTNNTTISSTSTKKSLSFSPVIKLHETFSAYEYDRRCDTGATCQKLTPVLALQIKEELNQFKLNDMFVHVDSRQNTHFFI